jgi:hypothetical protein
MKQPEDVLHSSQILEFAIGHFRQAGFEYEPIHGLRHLRGVIQECETICRMCPIDSLVTWWLKIAVIAHDLGRTMPGDHAENSANIFARMPLHDLLECEKSWIEFAIRNHSRGVKAATGHKVASNPGEILLGLLCVCDHADGASPEGYARSILWAKKGNYKTFSEKFSKELLFAIMENNYPPKAKDALKSDSITAHLVFNFSATKQITNAVMHLLSEEYIKHAEMRQMMFGKMVELLLELQPL